MYYKNLNLPVIQVDFPTSLVQLCNIETSIYCLKQNKRNFI